MRCAFHLLACYPRFLALSLLLLAAPSRPALAHEFVVALRAVGAEQEKVVTAALKGFLLATAEKDGHADETSNGHLGGLDVYIIPQPNGVTALFPELIPPPSSRPDIIVVIGPSDDAAAAMENADLDSVTIRPGILDNANRWSAAEMQDPKSFAARYRSAYKQPASRWAAEGYNAARRIDDAIRPLNGVDNRAALNRAFALSADGIRW